jgi:hypothetical protein
LERAVDIRAPKITRARRCGHESCAPSDATLRLAQHRTAYAALDRLAWFGALRVPTMRTTKHSRHALVCCAVLSCALLVARASAQTPLRGPALNWVRLPGADGCIAPVELANRVEQRLGRSVFVRANDAIVVIEGRVGPEPDGGFSAVLRVSDPSGTLYGTRELRSASQDCRELDEIAALVIAITIRHEHTGTAIELPATVAAQLDALFAGEPSVVDPGELPSAHAAPAATASEAAARTASLTAATPERSWRLGLDAGLLLETGIQPTTAFVAELRLYAALQHIGSVALTGLLSVPQTQVSAAQASGQLEHRFFAFGAQWCPPPWQLWLSELALCGELRAGQLSVEPSGFRVEHGVAHELWAELVPSAAVRARLIGPSRVLLAVGMPIRLLRPEFRYVDDEGVSHTALVPSWLGFQLELALGVEF